MTSDSSPLAFHEARHGKLAVQAKVPLASRRDLSLAYTPGVAEPCQEIVRDERNLYKYTMKANTVAVVTNGSATLGLGNIGAAASLPVMEGKCILFKQFAGVDALPLCIDTEDTNEFVEIVCKLVAPFGGINLEDIAAPQCFEIEQKLTKKLNIPVFHDDQHGTAIVVLAALINALNVSEKNLAEVKIVLSGAGAAGSAIARLLMQYGAQQVLMCDRKGVLVEGREDLAEHPFKLELAKLTNPNKKTGQLSDVLVGADVFIGVSSGGLLKTAMVASMAKNAIVFAMANPTPEIMPDEAKEAGAAIVGTGRSDFPNQINNVLVFPGMLRGLLDGRVHNITPAMHMAAAEALASLVPSPTPAKILPDLFEDGVSGAVARAVQKVR